MLSHADRQTRFVAEAQAVACQVRGLSPEPIAEQARAHAVARHPECIADDCCASCAVKDADQRLANVWKHRSGPCTAGAHLTISRGAAAGFPASQRHRCGFDGSPRPGRDAVRPAGNATGRPWPRHGVVHQAPVTGCRGLMTRRPVPSLAAGDRLHETRRHQHRTGYASPVLRNTTVQACGPAGIRIRLTPPVSS